MLLSKKPKTRQAGTNRFAGQSGQSLACVRHDAEQRSRFKTIKTGYRRVSLWQPSVNPIVGDQVVSLRVGVNEIAIQRRINHVGGKWNRQLQVWEILSDQAIALGLKDRIQNP